MWPPGNRLRACGFGHFLSRHDGPGAERHSGATVRATDNIFGAGHTGANQTPGGGTVATGYALTPGTGRILTFSSVTGTISPNGGANTNGPDGGTVSSTNVSSIDGISGIAHLDRAAYLVGVFVGTTEPANPAPAILTFSDTGRNGSTATNFNSLSMLLNQTFYIGDGLTGIGTGSTQQFFVPDTATELFLGIADAPGYTGSPGSYSDNSGTYTASFSVAAPVPEPGSLCLGFAAAAGLLAARQRRRR